MPFSQMVTGLDAIFVVVALVEKNLNGATVPNQLFLLDVELSFERSLSIIQSPFHESRSSSTTRATFSTGKKIRQSKL